MEESLEARVQEMKESVQRSIKQQDPFLARPDIVLFDSLIECESNVYLGDAFRVRVGFVSMREGEDISHYHPVAILSPSVEKGIVIVPIQKPLVLETGEIFSCSFATDGFPEGRYVVVVKYDENRTGGRHHTIDIYKRSTVGKYLASFFGVGSLEEMWYTCKADGTPANEFTWDGILLLRDENIKREMLASISSSSADQKEFESKLDAVFEKALRYWEKQLHAMFGDHAEQFLTNMKKPQKAW